MTHKHLRKFCRVNFLTLIFTYGKYMGHKLKNAEKCLIFSVNYNFCRCFTSFSNAKKTKLSRLFQTGPKSLENKSVFFVYIHIMRFTVWCMCTYVTHKWPNLLTNISPQLAIKQNLLRQTWSKSAEEKNIHTKRQLCRHNKLFPS